MNSLTRLWLECVFILYEFQHYSCTAGGKYGRYSWNLKLHIKEKYSCGNSFMTIGVLTFLPQKQTTVYY